MKKITSKKKGVIVHYYLTCVSVISLILMGLCWELFLAPLRPGGSWLVLKIFPLLFALPGLLKKKIYTYQWASMLSMFYFSEGIVRAYSEINLSKILALSEIILSFVFFLSSIYYVKLSRKS